VSRCGTLVRVLRWTDRSQIPAGYGPSVVTLGNFDGVHRGHVEVLQRMVDRAGEIGGNAVAVTFSPHPAVVHRPERPTVLVTGDVDRLELLSGTGIDATLVVAYDLAFARQPPRDFVRDYLVRPLNASVVVVGRDVRFGLDNSGDLDTMIALGEELGFTVEVVEDHAHDDDDGTRRWSSSWVRELLAAGDVRAAATILGRPHRVRGTVVRGDQRGRELGFPTANLASDSSGMVPADGVYAGWVRVLDAPGGDSRAAVPLPAAVSIGTNPTFDGAERRVEAYVLDRTDLELYGREIVVELVARVRDTLRFDSVDELVQRMHSDVVAVAAELAES